MPDEVVHDAPALTEIRAAIDAIDERIVVLLAEREALVRRAGSLKTSRSAVAAPERARHVVRRAAALGAERGADRSTISAIFGCITESFIALELRLHGARDGARGPRPSDVGAVRQESVEE